MVYLLGFSYGWNDWGYAGYAGADSVNFMRGLGGNLPNGPSNRGELKASRVKVASDCICIADTQHQETKGWQYNIDPGNPDEAPGAIHRGGSNVLFCDGHVEWFRQVDIVSPFLVTNGRFNPNGSGYDNRPGHAASVAQMWNNDHSTQNSTQ